MPSPLESMNRRGKPRTTAQSMRKESFLSTDPSAAHPAGGDAAPDHDGPGLRKAAHPDDWWRHGDRGRDGTAGSQPRQLLPLEGRILRIPPELQR